MTRVWLNKERRERISLTAYARYSCRLDSGIVGTLIKPSIALIRLLGL